MIPDSDAARGPVDEWSVVRYDGTTEEITMRLQSATAFSQAALIMPVPSRATFSLGDDAVFDDLAARTKPRVEKKKRYVLFGTGGGFGGAQDDGAVGAAGGGVEVVDEQDLGPLRVITLRGRDASAVGRFLDDQGFETPEDLEPIAQEYLDKSWLIVAARLRAASDGEQLQTLQPLVIRFAAEQDGPVYPLRMSDLASGPTQARVDLIAPTAYHLRAGGTWPRDDLREPSPSRTGRIYGGPIGPDEYLSSFQFAVSPGHVETDPEFVAMRRDDLRQVDYDYENVQIGGWILLGLFALFVVGGGLLAVFIARRRIRRA